MVKFFKDTWSVFQEEGFFFLFFLSACFTHNMDNGSFVYFGFSLILFVYAAFGRLRIYYDNTVLYLLLFALFYTLFYPYFDFSGAIRKLLGPPLFYMYGRYVVARGKYNEDVLIKVVLLMIVGLSFPLWWAVISNMIQGNIVSTSSIEGARWLTTWGQSKMAAATLYGLIAAFGLCGLGVSIMMKAKLNDMDRWLFLICGVCSVLSVLYLINRGGLVVAIMGIIIAIIYRSHGNVGKFLIFASFVFIIFALFFSENLLPSEFAESYSERSSVLEGGDRSWRWVDALSRMFYMPFGWITDTTIPYNYVHNTWLDIARDAGILPFIFFLLPTIQSIKSGIKLMKEKDNNMCLCLITLYTGVFLAYFIEPVLESNIFHIMIFAWIWGLMKEYSKVTNNSIIISSKPSTT